MDPQVGIGTHVSVVAHEDQALSVIGVDPDELVKWLKSLGCTTTLTQQTTPTDTSDLSAREREMIALVGSGLSNREIAGRMYVSINTVKSYVRSAYRKIGVGNRSGAVRWAIRHDFAQAENDADHHPVDDTIC